jgi:hypothetical protein
MLGSEAGPCAFGGASSVQQAKEPRKSWVYITCAIEAIRERTVQHKARIAINDLK